LKLAFCHRFAILPVLPEPLRKLALEYLSRLEAMAPLPGNLEELSLTGCEKLKEFEHIPHKLKSLKIDAMQLFQILNLILPQTLEQWQLWRR
jgi:hypothetical protein